MSEDFIKDLWHHLDMIYRPPHEPKQTPEQKAAAIEAAQAKRDMRKKKCAVLKEKG